MIKTTIIKQVDDGKYIYRIGNWVRVLMKPRFPEFPQLASEFIGEIVEITEDTFTLDCILDNAIININKIDKIRFARDNEDFENTPYF